MSETEYNNSGLTVNRLASLALAVIAIGLASSAYRDDSMFTMWLEEESGLPTSRVNEWRRGAIEEVIFISVISILSIIGLVHLLATLYVPACSLSLWSVVYLIFVGLVVFAVTGLEISSVARYEARIHGYHPCTNKAYSYTVKNASYFCQETASKATAAVFGIVIGILRLVEAYMSWRDIMNYRKDMEAQLESYLAYSRGQLQVKPPSYMYTFA